MITNQKVFEVSCIFLSSSSGQKKKGQVWRRSMSVVWYGTISVSTFLLRTRSEIL